MFKSDRRDLAGVIDSHQVGDQPAGAGNRVEQRLDFAGHALEPDNAGAGLDLPGARDAVGAGADDHPCVVDQALYGT